MAQYPKPNAKKIFFPRSCSSLREEEEQEEQEEEKDLQRRRRREREEKEEEKEEKETMGRVVEVRIFSFNLMRCFLFVFQSKLIIKLVFCSFL